MSSRHVSLGYIGRPCFKKKIVELIHHNLSRSELIGIISRKFSKSRGNFKRQISKGTVW
jgi:hypothetical protein